MSGMTRVGLGSAEVGLRAAWRFAAISIAIGVVAVTVPALAVSPAGHAGHTDHASLRSSMLTRLLDRARIENLLTDYYSGFGPRAVDMGTFYTPDGVLDVNGIVAKGPKEIDALYKRIGAASPPRAGKYDMLITNLKIVVHGDTATSQNIWTGVLSATPESTPRFIEQGHERDTLVKRGGRWYFEHREITSDGGLTKMFEKTYRNR
ncbi:MAG: nuclear transport factor 2 family protein [Steroidobacteraceae bacterium]